MSVLEGYRQVEASFLHVGSACGQLVFEFLFPLKDL